MCVSSVQAVEILDPVVVTGFRVANEQPAGSIAMPVTLLRYEPLVDVQTRNAAEGQADIAIRGGIFENTAFLLGGLAIYDPQTGHYTAELPVSTEMLRSPEVLTGFEHAASSFNATAGSLRYDWSPVRTRGFASLAGGPRGFNRQQVYQGYVARVAETVRLGVDVDLARSEGDGPRASDLDVVFSATPAGATVPLGDVGEHEFGRLNARLTLETARTTTQVFHGYQSKFFAWPNLYTPFGWPESENLQTNLAVLTHEFRLSDEALMRFEGYYRRHRDDYEADTRLPGRFSPYQHQTEVTGGALSGQFEAGTLTWRTRVAGIADSIESTNVEVGSPGSQGRFDSRTHWQVSVVPERSFELSRDSFFDVRAGVVFDDTNRESEAWSPLAELAWRRGGFRIYAGRTEGTQVAGYTALNSSPTGGLFRGNPNLGRATTTNWEAGASFSTSQWSARAAVFQREDRGMTDWIIPFNPALTPAALRTTARFASQLDVDTLGAEVELRRAWGWLEIASGYTWLEKDSSYPNATTPVFGSYYGLNFPKHRATLAVIARPFAGFTVRVDNEYRIQEANPLRTSGSRAYALSVGLAYAPPSIEGLEFGVTADNVLDDDFQEVPSVPAAPRTWSASVAYRW